MHRSTYRAWLKPAACIALKVIVSALIWIFCLPLLIGTVEALVGSFVSVLYLAFDKGTHIRSLGDILALVRGPAGFIAWIWLAAMNIFWIRGRRLQGRLARIGTPIAVLCVALFIPANVLRHGATTLVISMMFVPGVAFASYLVWWHTRAPSAARHADGNHR